MDCIHKGLVAAGTATQWQLVQPLLGVQQECVRRPCLAAATMGKHPHPLFLRLKDEEEGKQRSLEMVGDWEMNNHSNNILKVRRLKPLVTVMMLPTMELREKAKRTAMALEMLQGKKKERMRLSVKRTRSAKTGNSVYDIIGVFMLQHFNTRLLSGRAHTLPGTEKARLL